MFFRMCTAPKKTKTSNFQNVFEQFSSPVEMFSDDFGASLDRFGSLLKRFGSLMIAFVVVGYSATDLIFPFSENGPANYNFSLFSKLPTNYPNKSKNIQKPIYLFRKYQGPSHIFNCFLNI